MSPQSRALLGIVEIRIEDAARSVWRSAACIGLFVVWCALTGLAPRLPASWGGAPAVVVGSALGYGVLTAIAMVALVWKTLFVVWDRYTRQVIAAHLLPVTWLAVLAALPGLATGWIAGRDPLSWGWIGGGTGLATFLLATVAARILEWTRLRRSLAELDASTNVRESWPSGLHSWPTMPNVSSSG